jgi:3-phenylpropionate/trans-cinnamate dioxygenase ferredoxin reductase subunit
MAATEWHIRGEMNAANGSASSFVMYGVTEGQIVAGITVNAAKEMRHLKKMISQNTAFEAEKHLDLSLDLRKVA